MKLRYDFDVQEMGTQYCASTVNVDDFNGAIFFSEVGKTIFEELKVGVEREELIEKLLKKYIGKREEIEAEVDKFLDTLTQNGLLVD